MTVARRSTNEILAVLNAIKGGASTYVEIGNATQINQYRIHSAIHYLCEDYQAAYMKQLVGMFKPATTTRDASNKARKRRHNSVVIDDKLSIETAANLLLDVFGEDWCKLVVGMMREIRRRERVSA